MLIQQNKFYWISDRSMVAHLNYTDTFKLIASEKSCCTSHKNHIIQVAVSILLKIFTYISAQYVDVNVVVVAAKIPAGIMGILCATGTTSLWLSLNTINQSPFYSVPKKIDQRAGHLMPGARFSKNRKFVITELWRFYDRKIVITQLWRFYDRIFVLKFFENWAPDFQHSVSVAVKPYRFCKNHVRTSRSCRCYWDLCAVLAQQAQDAGCRVREKAEFPAQKSGRSCRPVRMADTEK